MKCHYHPDREAVGMCVSCGEPVCLECKVVLDNKIHCNKCVESDMAKLEEVSSINWWIPASIFGIIIYLIALFSLGTKHPLIRNKLFLFTCSMFTFWLIALIVLNWWGNSHVINIYFP